MASLDFPSNPTNNQTYSLNGVTYYYNSAIGAWLTQLSTMNLSTSSNTQVLFNDAGLANGSSGLVFDKVANTLTLNQISGPAGNVISSAFGKANTALQNTSGTFAGNLTVTGTANVIGSLYVTNISHINTYTINYLIVAGGGGGGGSIAGGGGGGGFVTASANVSVGTSLTATVGAGGPNGTNGSDSSLSGFEVALGGGSSPGYNGYGYSGGSGGGGARASGPGGAIQRGGPPRYRQGNCGGNGSNSGGTDNYGSGGGGGGAGGRGGDASGSTAGAGGIGATWINGNTYAGGGGGSAYNGTGGPGSDTYGGGGSGTGSNSVGGAGTVNTGGGGGSGGYSGGGAAGGAGGSGIVIIAYLGSQRGTGGTVTSSGGYTYHTFTTSGTFTA